MEKSNLTLTTLLILSATLITGCDKDSKWTLLWQDNFDSFDSARWEKAAHTFGVNDSRFVEKNVTFQNGIMKLHLTDEPAGGKLYAGAEYRTRDSFLYGKFEVRMKFASGSGVVSSFFTYKDPSHPRWNEIDIEVLGRDTRKMQFTHWWNKTPDFKPVTYDLDFAVDEDFHIYVFEWLPKYIKWYIDGKLMHTAADNIPDLSQKIMMNIWICNLTDWAGKFDKNILPVYAEYDYVKYYELR